MRLPCLPVQHVCTPYMCVLEEVQGTVAAKRRRPWATVRKGRLPVVDLKAAHEQMTYPDGKKDKLFSQDGQQSLGPRSRDATPGPRQRCVVWWCGGVVVVNKAHACPFRATSKTWAFILHSPFVVFFLFFLLFLFLLLLPLEP